MKNILVFPYGSTEACRYAASFLAKAGVPLLDHPAPEVTHLLLDVPSFGGDGMLRGGGDLKALLRMLPAGVMVVGGNLAQPQLQGHKTLDLLQDETYLAANAAITADCALRVAGEKLTTTFADTPVLVIGWGRIGKCLGSLLKAVGAEVTIAARKETDRAMIGALGFQVTDLEGMKLRLPKFRLIFNTAPTVVAEEQVLAAARNCVKIDLASKPGLLGEDVIRARGLPGIHAPESSGRLIADTFLRLTGEDFV